MYKALFIVDRLLTTKDVPHWAVRGTLLGAVKVGGIILDDDDVDIGVFKSDLPAIKKLLKEAGIEYEKSDSGIVINMSYGKVDLITYKKINGKYVSNKDYFAIRELLPLRKVGFTTQLLLVPSSPEEYLKREYYPLRYRPVLYVPSRKINFERLMQEWGLSYFRRIEKSKNPFNKYFQGVYVINLHDYRKRLSTVDKRLKNAGVKYSVFDAIDGRCKTAIECKRKRTALEYEFKVKIDKHESLPPLSLTLGTWLILKNQVKNNLQRIVIFEDDAYPVKNFMERFEEGVKELKKIKDWDVLYLGCTQMCGHKGISRYPTAKEKNLTTLNKFNKYAKYYVGHRFDIRSPCGPVKCKEVTKNISVASEPAGGYGYCISLKGAKKILRMMKNTINDHMDGLIPNYVVMGKLKAFAFDPPIVHHYGGAERADTALEWDWGEYELDWED